MAPLRSLFGRICITTVVRDEVLPAASGHVDMELPARTLAEGWIDAVDLPRDAWKPLNPGVDAGAASAIQAACVWRDAGDAVLLVIDDRAGRSEARSRGLALIGTAGLIGLAKTAGIVPQARPLLDRLTQTGYLLGPAVVAAVLAEVGE